MRIVNRWKFFTICIYALLLLVVATFIYDNWRNSKNRIYFNAASIEGSINKISTRKALVIVSIDNDTNVYSFVPIIANNGLIFERLAEKGDTLIKLENSDIITLIKRDGEKYEFKFKK
jgi:hypothetical protein